jgi:cytochrome c5
MKNKLFFLAVTTVFLASCSSKKSATVAAAKTPKEVVLTPELLAGKSLYENSCVRCHKLYSPKEYTQESWKPILVKMQRKARLDDAQIASISNYITSQL